jgi:hypothetical protein
VVAFAISAVRNAAACDPGIGKKKKGPVVISATTKLDIVGAGGVVVARRVPPSSLVKNLGRAARVRPGLYKLL